MAGKKVILKHGRTELVFPVAPSSYEIEEGINVEIINLHEFGDYPAAGYQTSHPISLVLLLPNNDYSFASDNHSARYTNQIKRWKDGQGVVRCIISDTRINLPVMIEHYRIGEDDGTGDINLHLTLRYKPQLEPIAIQKTPTQAKRRKAVESAESGTTHTIVYGDTLSAICWKYYGSAAPDYWNKLAQVNGQPNPHLIPLGTVLKIPKPLF